MHRLHWVGFGAVMLSITAYLTTRLSGEDRTVFLPGATSHGHYQIELSCESCHTPLGGVRSDACLKCHSEELARADDSHPPSKFLDPRNAALLTKLNARECHTCHLEHRPHLTAPIGVTMPEDYCAHCHAEIGEERPTHAGLSHATCQSVGCHNFHDNRGLHEDYLEAHLDEPVHAATQLRPMTPRLTSEGRALGPADADAKEPMKQPESVADWSSSAHAHGGVNCSDCHGGKDSAFVRSASDEACAACHAQQQRGFREGHHGMRLAVGLPPMRPELARLPMRESSHGRELGCTSCHKAHTFDRTFAAAAACVECHDDEHSRAYEASPHGETWRKELAGELPKGAGVSCASCHMPTLPVAPGSPELFVQHNQNDNLRPREKMLRSVCTHCHSVGFSLDALADEALVRANFRGAPRVHVESLDWIRQRTAARAQAPDLTP